MTARAYRPLWRRRLLAPVLGLLGLNALVFAAFTLPRSLAERSLAARAGALRAEADWARGRAAALRRRADNIASNAQDSDRFYREVVRRREEALLPTLEEIQKIASDLGLKLRNRSYKPEAVDGAPLTRFVVTMPVAGSYRQLVSFLERIERSHLFLFVDAVSLREREGTGEADLSIAISAYFRAERGKKGA